MDRLIPLDATRAALASIRTTSQSFATAIPTMGVVVAPTGDWWTAMRLGSGTPRHTITLSA